MQQHLAQIGVDPGGVAVGYLIIMLFVVFLAIALVGVTLFVVLKSAFPQSDPVLKIGLPRSWVRVKPPKIMPYAELTEKQRDAIFGVRAEVFLIEQGITSVPDRDGRDAACEHVLVYAGRRVIATARLEAIEAKGLGETRIKVGRLAVLKGYRGRGVGRAIMLAVNDLLDRRCVGGVMSAQSHLESWYASLGWMREGEPFMEAGIGHIKMYYSSQ